MKEFTFIYLENDFNMNFKSLTLAIEAAKEMAINIVDLDGKESAEYSIHYTDLFDAEVPEAIVRAKMTSKGIKTSVEYFNQ